MRTLFVYKFCGLGGVETSIINKMRVLRKIGIESEVYFREYYGEGGRSFSTYGNIHLELTEAEVIALLEKDFDYIVIIDYPEFFRFIEQCEPTGKIIFETHISEMPALQKVCVQASHPDVAAIIVPSNFNRELVCQFTGNTPRSREVFVLPNPVDSVVFKKLSPPELKPEIQHLASKRNIIWVGRVEENKNTLGFVRLAAELVKTEKDLHFIVVGDYLYTEDYKALVDESLAALGLQEHFTFIQGLPYKEMPQIYSLAAHTGGCLVSTSRNESVPMVFLEAFACKCPVVAPLVGGVAELVTHDFTGLIYLPDDLNGGIKAVRDLLNKDDVRKKIVDNAFGRAMCHSIDYISFKYQQIFQQIKNIQHFRQPKPVVSILLPVHNGAEFLQAALDSICTQTYQNFELIVINDASTDGTQEILRSYQEKDERIRVIVNKFKQGVAGSLNVGIGLARGRYIARMDGDDISEPERLQEQVAFLETHPEVGLVGSWWRLIDTAGQIIKPMRSFIEHEDIIKASLANNPFCHGSIMGRTNLFRELTGYDPRYEAAEDYDLWLRLMDKSQVAILPRYLYQLRVHNFSVSVKDSSKQLEKANQARLNAINRRGLDYRLAIDFSEYWEDRCFFYNSYELVKNARVLIYSANWPGEKVRYLLEKMNCYQLGFITDTWEQITADTANYPIFLTEDLPQVQYDYIIIAEQDWLEAEEHLLQLSVEKAKILYGFYVRMW